MIQALSYELSILTKAVQHKNLSAAAVHVGLSQPQLSRLIAKIEAELKVVLLDRTARRKSGWTPIAHDLSLTFSRGIGRLEAEVLALAQDREVNEVHVGTLEGLGAIATQFARQCFFDIKLKTVYLDVYDFRDLDSEFLSGNLDLIFTVRPPGKQKFSHLIEVGFQQMETVSTNEKVGVFSPYEVTGSDRRATDNFTHSLICNSLSIRSHWLHEHGGTGTLPVDAKKGKGKGAYTIYLVGSDLLSPKLWEKITKLF